MSGSVKPLPPSRPRVDVWRDPQGDYVFMHLAQVTPGHLVAWGNLRRMSSAEAAVEGYEYVLASLGEFARRNGRLKRGRLTFQPGEFASLGADRLHITLAMPGTLTLARQLPPEPDAVQVPLTASTAEFFTVLAAAFSSVRSAAT